MLAGFLIPVGPLVKVDPESNRNHFGQALARIRR